MPWLAPLLAAAAVGLWSQDARASLAARSVEAAAATLTVEGRVIRLDPRIDAHGYPVTDVTLDSGTRFTILGGVKDGLRWVVDEEASFAVGDRVRVRLERGPDGLRPWAGREGVEPLSFELPPSSALSEITPTPTVTSVTPTSGPAVADDQIQVEVRGDKFGEAQGSSGVFFQGLFVHVPAGEVLSWSDTLIECVVPRPGLIGIPQVLSGSVKVWTPIGGWSDGAEFDGGAEYHVLFQYAGDSWSETSLPIQYYINPSGFPWPADDVVQMVLTAADTWHRAPNTYGRFHYVGFTSHVAGRDKDSTNVIGWTTPWPHSPSWLAVTWSGIDSLSGERREVDVEINGDRAWSIGARPAFGTFDLPTTMAHEFGHWIRLGHVQEPGYLMLAFQSEDEMRRNLADGDRQGASWVYPTFGSARASRDTVLVENGSSDPLNLEVSVADRRGRALVGMAPGDLYAIGEWLPDDDGPTVPAGIFYPDGPTDAQGRARFTIVGITGLGRLRFTVVGGVRSVRDRPVVTVFDPNAVAPGTWIVSAPTPNPARSGRVESVIRLGSPARRLTARVLDARGRLVSVLRDGPAAAGEVHIAWDFSTGQTPDPGMYFLDVQAGHRRTVKKIVVLGP